jgi:hypothetical protein
VFRIEVPKDEGNSSETLVIIYRNNLGDKNLNFYRRVHPSIPFLQKREKYFSITICWGLFSFTIKDVIIAQKWRF